MIVHVHVHVHVPSPRQQAEEAEHGHVTYKSTTACVPYEEMLVEEKNVQKRRLWWHVAVGCCA